jgi:hypothetical protein
MDLGEKFYGYTMNEQGQYPEPVVINTKDQLSEFLVNNVTKHYELRITDTSDCLVMHVVKQSLVFPVPEHGKAQNHWDVKTNRFVND